MDVSTVATQQALSDMLQGGLLSVTGSWTVHLGTTSPALTPFNTLDEFKDPFYPEYAPVVWDPFPIQRNLDGTVSASGISASFNAPSQMPQTLYTGWVTYTDSDGNEQLLESWYLIGEPVAFGPGGEPYVANLGFGDMNSDSV